MNHVLYCCGQSGFDSWATIPMPEGSVYAQMLVLCWEVVKASEWSIADRQTGTGPDRPQLSLRWAKSLVLSETLYISTIGLCWFSQRVQQIRTQKLTSAFGVINLPHSCHSIPDVVVNFFCAYCYIYEFGRWFYPKWLTFKVKKICFMGSLGIKPMIFIVSWDQIWNATIVSNSPIVYIVFTHFWIVHRLHST